MGKSVVPSAARAVVGDAALYDGKMLDLIRRMVAKDCNNDEFDVFIATCRAISVDPLRKQAYAFVHNKDDPKKRQLTIVTAISALRTIADRTGNYRPDEECPELHFDERLVCPSNPKGLVKAIIRVWKFSHGAWHPIKAEAYWDAYAPIKEPDDAFDWIETGEFWPDKDGNPSRKPKKKKVRKEGAFEPVLDTSGRWGKDPCGMLPKCAEALALRKGWPDDLSNVHAEEEIDRQKFLDLTATEAVQASEELRRIEKIGGRGNLIVDWLKGDMAPLEAVPEGQFADLVCAFIELHREEPAQVMMFAERNKHAFREFWAAHPSDALELKKKIEKAVGQ